MFRLQNIKGLFVIVLGPNVHHDSTFPREVLFNCILNKLKDIFWIGISEDGTASCRAFQHARMRYTYMYLLILLNFPTQFSPTYSRLFDMKISTHVKGQLQYHNIVTLS